MGDLKQMYPGAPFFPSTVLVKPASPTETAFYVSDISCFPDAPNLATVSYAGVSETILYTQKNENALLGCTRGVEGTALAWSEGSTIQRAFTDKDYQTLIDNITALNEGKADKDSNDNVEKAYKDLSNVENMDFLVKSMRAGVYSSANQPPYPVTSVAGKVGAVALNKTDIGLDNVENVKQYSASNEPPYPVKKVAGKTGEVSLEKADVGLENVDNVRQYSASNQPPYPVTKVAGKTGAVTLSKSDVGLSNIDNVRQYSSSNPPPYPVTSRPCQLNDMI